MISVCMATYNGEKYIKQQLDSILSQIGNEDEIIISDDGSRDRTSKIVESYNDERIKYIQNHGKHGFSHNFENALKNVKGDIIFLSDQDDIWLPDKVSEMSKALIGNDLVISDCKTVDVDLNVIKKSRFQEFHIKGTKMEHFIKSRYIGCCLAFNRKVLDACLPFPENDFLVEHDIWVVAVAMTYFKTSLITKPLILYRRHGANVSTGGFTKGYSMSIKVKKRVYRLYCLLKQRKHIMKVKNRKL